MRSSDGDQAGSVAASHAVEEHPAGRRLLDRVEHALDLFREAVHEGPVVERGPELGPVNPVRPELGIRVELVERDVHHVDAERRGAAVQALVVVAQVDDRPDAMRAERLPAGGRQAVDRLGAN